MHSISSLTAKTTVFAIAVALLLRTGTAFALPSDCANGLFWCPTAVGDVSKCTQATCCIENSCACLLEPMPNGSNVICTDSQSFFDSLLFQYFNTGGLWSWGLGIGVGLAVLNVTFAGFQIMMSNGDQAKVSQGKDRILWSIFGLILLMFAGVILHFINPIGFS